ncbi:rod shape-determining protein MreC [Oscillatoriales cyanobacterium USR001]|nr:rod shape-determining protein MreC [Oscillatoriales cyanobacterium USR001]
MLKNTLRRWWDLRLQIAMLALVLSGAWFVRETQGQALFEIYGWVTRPFQINAAEQEQMLNARTKEIQDRLADLQAQNQKLQQLLGYISTQKNPGIAAPIVGRSSDHWWQQVILGKGSKDGIQKGFIVMSPGGVVGRVINVTPNTSLVILISDPTSRVGVAVSRSRHMGFLKGKGDKSKNRAVMEFFDNVPNVKPGDVVSTSSFSQLYPPGLPVGIVESLDMNKSPAPEAIIVFSAPINSLEWVVVYPHKEPSGMNFPETKPSPINPAQNQPSKEEGGEEKR